MQDKYTAELEARKRAYENVQDADKLSETEFSGLFHEARTNSRQIYTSVSLPVAFNCNGSFAVGEPVRSRQGEHFRANDNWDDVISLSVQPFMDTQTAKQEILRQIRGPLSF